MRSLAHIADLKGNIFVVLLRSFHFNGDNSPPEPKVSSFSKLPELCICIVLFRLGFFGLLGPGGEEARGLHPLLNSENIEDMTTKRKDR